jgi:hypothetical protein
MFSHIMIGSNDIARSKKFYDALFVAMGAQPGVEVVSGGPAITRLPVTVDQTKRRKIWRADSTPPSEDPINRNHPLIGEGFVVSLAGRRPVSAQFQSRFQMVSAVSLERFWAISVRSKFGFGGFTFVKVASADRPYEIPIAGQPIAGDQLAPVLAHQGSSRIRSLGVYKAEPETFILPLLFRDAWA